MNGLSSGFKIIKKKVNSPLKEKQFIYKFQKIPPAEKEIVDWLILEGKWYPEKRWEYLNMWNIKVAEIVEEKILTVWR